MNDQNLNQFDGGLGGGDNSSGDKGNGGGPSKNPKKQNIILFVIAALISLLLVSAFMNFMTGSSEREISYNEFIQMLDEDKVASVTIDSDRIYIQPKVEQSQQNPLMNLYGMSSGVTFYTGKIEDNDTLTNRLLEHSDVEVKGKVADGSGAILGFLLTYVFPFLLMWVLLSFLFRKMSKGGGPMGVGKSNAKVYVQKETGITFKDVAGEDEAKESLQEVVDFLHNPMKYASIGAKLPKGALLVGPPGTGKTSIGASVARALKRKYVRVSLGGVRDEADIRGHRKTYIAAMPGRIVTAINQAGTMNPVILLDEIDKLTRDAHGDPASALLEVLDAEQNKAFRDHYIEVPFDLSKVLFVATANSLDPIPAPLLDRMEIIELGSYTREEKFHIAKEHLLKKQLKKHGLKGTQCRIPDEVLYAIIDGYTREAGVRELERTIGTLCRKAAKEIVEGICKKVSFTEVNLKEYLGIPKFRPDEQSHEDTVGVVNGLAWTSVGGVLMPMEVLVMSGKGTVEYTGSLGNVMQESAKIAVSYARSVAKQYGIPEDFHTKCDLHIHAPEGAVPKDGPSAGVTMATAIISALSGRPVRGDIAMTGEITLHGNVLPIGGLREKSMAAYKAGIHTVIIPEENLPDLEEVDETVREHVTFVLAKTLDTVLNTALVPAEPAAEAQTAAAELCHV